MSQYGVDADLLARAVDTLAAQPKVRKVVLFGSRARGDYSPGSDIDLAVSAPGLGFNEFLDLRASLSGRLWSSKWTWCILKHSPPMRRSPGKSAMMASCFTRQWNRIIIFVWVPWPTPSVSCLFENPDALCLDLLVHGIRRKVDVSG